MADPFIAEIRIFAGNFAPAGWAFCDGQLLPVSQNTALFSLLGTTYGGNGMTTFALPDLRGRAPMHPGTGQGLTPRTLGETGGTERVTLDASQLPAHGHTLALPAVNGPATSPEPEGKLPASAGENTFSAEGTPTNMSASALAPAYGGGSHNNLQLYLTLNFIIALQGVYPPRD